MVVESEWHHSASVNKAKADELLKGADGEYKDGTFLVRKKANAAGTSLLSIVYKVFCHATPVRPTASAPWGWVLLSIARRWGGHGGGLRVSGK